MNFKFEVIDPTNFVKSDKGADLFYIHLENNFVFLHFKDGSIKKRYCIGKDQLKVYRAEKRYKEVQFDDINNSYLEDF